MLDDLDTVDWTRLHHAYGPATDVPDLIRAVAGSDDEAAERGRRQLDGSVIHQGTTYSATAPVVPFLARLLTAQSTHHRAKVAWLLGEMAAYNNQRTRHVATVRMAVTAEVDRLLPMLADPDPAVRGGVSFALSQCPKRKRDTVPALRARFAVEDDPQTQALLLAAVQWLDPKTDLVTGALGEDNPPPLRAAAALVLARSELPWSAEADAAVRAGWEAGESLERCWWWGWQTSSLQELVRAVAGRGPECAPMLAMLLDSSSDSVREEATAAAVWAVRVQRAARSALVPVLTGALDDRSPRVRASAAVALREAGEVARPAADSLVRLGASGPDDAAGEAIAALVELNDPRWRDLLPGRLAAGASVVDAVDVLTTAGVPFDQTLHDAVLRRLEAMVTAGPMMRENDGIMLVASWGPAARTAVPYLLALDRPAQRADVLTALSAIGPAAAAALPMLRARVDANDTIAAQSAWGPFRVNEVAERLAIWRIAGDPVPALDGARAALPRLLELPRYGIGNVPHADAAALLEGLGDSARVLLPEVRQVLAAHQDFLGLARVMWGLTGEAELVAPTVQRVLEHAVAELKRRNPQYSGQQAAHLAAELGDASMVPLLRGLLADPTSRSRVPAARAIWRLTGDIEGLTGPLLKEVTPRPPGGRWTQALELLTEMGPAAREALPELRKVAEHPWSPFVDYLDSTFHRGLGHQDDRFLSAVRGTIAAIDTPRR